MNLNEMGAKLVGFEISCPSGTKPIGVSYLAGLFDSDLFDKIETNVYWNKPQGGFWCTPYSDRRKWKYMAASHRKFCKSLHKYNVYAPNTNILVINSYQDLHDAYNLYSYRSTSDSLSYERIAKVFDAIHITRRAIKECGHFTEGLSLKGWDIPSICFFNLKSFTVEYMGKVANDGK